MIRETLLEVFQTLQEKDPRLTVYKVAMEAKTNYSNLRDALEGKTDKNGRVRSFSDGQLKDLGECDLIPFDYAELKAMKILGELEPEVAQKVPETIKKLFELQDKKRGLG